MFLKMVCREMLYIVLAKHTDTVYNLIDLALSISLTSDSSGSFTYMTIMYSIRIDEHNSLNLGSE